jgi:uncharacterized protein DUF222
MCNNPETSAPANQAATPVAEMTTEQCLDVIVHAESMKAHYDAQKVQALARLAELRRPTRWGADLADGARDEVAIEIGVSPQSATTQILQAHSLVTRLPGTMKALSTGQIDYKRALSINDLTSTLSNEAALVVEQRVLAGGRRSNPTKFRDAVRYQVVRSDPKAAEQRRAEARQHRNVTFMPSNDSMGQLTARLTAEETVAAHRRITVLARQAKTSDRTLAQRRADVLMELILGKNAESVEVQVNVTVPMTTLMKLNEHPGEISGYGPITAEHARELARNATWRRIITDPAGRVLDFSPRRYPSPDSTNPASKPGTARAA